MCDIVLAFISLFVVNFSKIFEIKSAKNAISNYKAD